MKITLTNDFHNSKIVLRASKADPMRISECQRQRAKRKLCGISDCLCSGPLGTRGKQEVSLEAIYVRSTGKYDGARIKEEQG
jgi:hypothetical protein